MPDPRIIIPGKCLDEQQLRQVLTQISTALRVVIVETQDTGIAPTGPKTAGRLVFDTSDFKLYAATGAAWKSTTLT